MWAVSSIVHYSSLLKSTLSSIGFPNDATKMSGKTYSIFVRQSHKRDWGSGKEGMDLYLVFAAAAASLCLSSLSSPPCFEAIVKPWGSTICALNWPTKSENISLVSEFWKSGTFCPFILLVKMAISITRMTKASSSKGCSGATGVGSHFYEEPKAEEGETTKRLGNFWLQFSLQLFE